MRVMEYMEDLLEHIASVPGNYVPSLVAEALVVQACVFPVLDDKTRVGPGDWEPSFDGMRDTAYTTIIFSSMCYPRDESSSRVVADMAAFVRMLKGGRMIQIRYAWIDNDEDGNSRCVCKWCSELYASHEICDQG